MASTLLSDVIIPVVYESYTAVDSPELSAFFQSGVAVRNAALDNAFTAGGKIAHMPFWKDLDATIEPNYSNDDPASVAVPNKVVADEMIARVANMNQGYSAADLVSELAGSNPMQRIRNRFGTYWTRQFQHRLLKTVAGVLANNVANDASDMVVDLSIDDPAANGTAANLFSRLAFTGALFTLGDHFAEIGVIAVHSIVFKRMVDNGDIEFIRPEESDPNLPLSANGIPYFLGKRVVVDDGMPVAAGAQSGFKFTSVLFGSGAIGMGENMPLTPVEVYRRPDQGNGGGVEQLWERKSWVIHPFGHKFNSTTVAGVSPTNAEMARSDNWTRVVERKNVPLAFLITNG